MRAALLLLLVVCSSACLGPECAVDRDCDVGEKCVQVRGACVPFSCKDSDCGNYRCDSTTDRCATTCTDDLLCASGKRCQEGACVEPADTSGTCIDDSDCVEPTLCIGGFCRGPCESNADCPGRACDLLIGYCG